MSGSRKVYKRCKICKKWVKETWRKRYKDLDVAVICVECYNKRAGKK
jgi:hypothetical protein